MSPSNAASNAASDADLVAAHAAGDPDAFAELVRRHRERMWAVALRTLGDPEEAADALEEAFVSAFRAAASFRAESQVTTWLHRIVVNACLDRIRRRQARPTAPLPLTAPRVRRPASVDADKIDSLLAGSSFGSAAARELRARTTPETAARAVSRAGDLAGDRTSADTDAVRIALAGLSEELRVAVVLVDVEGYSVAETARMLGVAEATVKSRCARGRAKLARTLGADRGDRVDPRAGRWR
ncbi:sigma-70 family RNA polymerase sigma factor [Actinophytocola sp.]|jgi:RNA polymerase sigma-70 factor (ECF subfamily)|uniref:sigma-70 family RNA polymerase sigma factor n=1 Tax=Actinophytocola sp. TaxID=1872138 RepID=UPI002EDAAC6D